MQIRHKIPTIFNLSMVDVLCCALGCCILLWLLNLREAKERSEVAGKAKDELAVTQSKLETAKQSFERASREALAAAQERDRLAGELKATQSERNALKESLASLKGRYAQTEEQLRRLGQEERALVKEREDLNQKLHEVGTQLREKEAMLRGKEAMARAADKRAEELSARVRDADLQTKRVQAELEQSRTRLAAADARAETARQMIDKVEQEKKSLADQASRVRAAIENRFEGIALTGRRVIFLVDMSGSMELVDFNTAAPSKWTSVREALAKVMRSLTDLEKFQLLVFAEKASFPLGNDGGWLDFDAKTSVDRTVRALAALKPEGGTNMHTAFEAAFRYRADGLDTIYVFSDGLPNLGPGLTSNQVAMLKETEQSEILARYIRGVLRQDWNRPIAGKPRVRINTIGFFFESPDVGAFLWALARENDGSFVGMSKP